MTSTLMQGHNGQADIIFLPNMNIAFVREGYTAGEINVKPIPASDILIVSCEPEFVEFRLAFGEANERVTYCGNYTIFWRAQQDVNTQQSSTTSTPSVENSSPPAWTPQHSIPHTRAVGTDVPQVGPSGGSPTPPSSTRRPGPISM